uniref:Uncharacterized protein n=1 Tax=uncultured marine virus TaxID=186617 RepID=A0A0F7L839_9VIRU|nr:hypothetical protein [uncultured marine virus]
MNRLIYYFSFLHTFNICFIIWSFKIVFNPNIHSVFTYLAIYWTWSSCINHCFKHSFVLAK